MAVERRMVFTCGPCFVLFVSLQKVEAQNRAVFVIVIVVHCSGCVLCRIELNDAENSSMPMPIVLNRSQSDFKTSICNLIPENLL